jgi:CRP/FNR family transcriptional regulator
MNKKDFLKQNVYFQELDEIALDELSQICKEETFKASAIVFREHETAKRFYIIEEGIVTLKMEEGGSTLSTIIKKGDLFGWASLVEPYRYTATALALEDSKVLSIESDPFKNKFLQKDLKFAFNFMNRLVQLLCRRLEDSRKQLISSLSGAKPISQG